MTTVVLTSGWDPHALHARRCAPGTRLLVRLRSLSLDRALGRGMSPDSSVALSLRAHELIGPAHRLRVARRLRRIAAAAGQPRCRFDPCVPVPSHVSDALDLIGEVAATLEGPEAVDARGVAQLHVLVNDGGGPLFDPRAGRALHQALENALAALGPLSRASV